MSEPPLDLNKIKAFPKAPPRRPDKLTKGALAQQLHAAAITRAQLENQSFAQDMHQRRSFATSAFRFVCVWMILVVAIVIASAVFADGVVIRGVLFKFVLSEKVLITLLCTTTANVIGLLVIVMKYLFAPPRLTPKSGSKKQPS